MRASQSYNLLTYLSLICFLSCFSIRAEAAICEFTTTKEWHGGFQATIRITNNDEAIINGWEISWALPDGSTISGSWNAVVNGDNPYVATPLEWNTIINPGSSVEIGVLGKKSESTNPTPSPTISGDVCKAVSSSSAISRSEASVISSSTESASEQSSSSVLGLNSSDTESRSSRSESSSLTTANSSAIIISATSSSSISISSSGTTSSSSEIASVPSSIPDISDAHITGIDERPIPTTCIAGEAPSRGDLALISVWPNFNFVQPIGMVQLPGDENNDYYVMQKGGQILRLSADFNVDTADVFLDMSSQVETGGEGGVWSMVFHPDFPITPYIYVSHMVNNNGFETRISRFTSDGISVTDEKVIFSLPQNLSPFGSGSIHNAGSMAFGPDGYLYMTLGDDKRNNIIGNPSQLYGTIIRIDVDGTGKGVNNDGYAIPVSNAFDNEVYAYGFRNPWRFSFDKLTGQLWLADVGEECLEEVNLVQSGLDYGWPNWEGDQCGPTNTCAGSNTLPEITYHQGSGCSLGSSITGGYVYRGSKIPNLQGKYVYGDFQSGLVWAYDPSTKNNKDLFVEGRALGLAAFGEDNSGELFYIDLVNASIMRIENAVDTAIEGPPENLISTGCFNEVGASLSPAQGVIPYNIAQSFWSDGAEKERFLAIPEGTTFDINDNGDWELPVGGVLIKNFKWLGENFETRFFVRYEDGSYGGYTYEWIGENNAILVSDKGKNAKLSDGTTWRYPARNECLQCHTERAGFILGPETKQMNVNQFYPRTGRNHNQFETLNFLGMISGNTQALPPFPAIDDIHTDLDLRANAYIHINCSSCHRGAGGGQSTWDARYTTAFENKGVCNVSPVTSVTGASVEHYVMPGDHGASSIWWRMHERGRGQMPPIGSSITDLAGANLLARWIDDMTPGVCPEPTTSTCNIPNNLIQNCDFSAGKSPWELREGLGGNGSVEIVNEKYEITINEPSNDTWHLQSVQVIGAIDELNYQIRFDAKAASPRTIEVNVGEQGDDWTSLCQKSVVLTTESNNYIIDCGVLADSDGENNVKLDFNVGNDGTASVTIDNVYFGK